MDLCQVKISLWLPSRAESKENGSQHNNIAKRRRPSNKLSMRRLSWPLLVRPVPQTAPPAPSGKILVVKTRPVHQCLVHQHLPMRDHRTIDRTKMSNRDGVYVLTAAAQSVGQTPEELIINRESFRRSRMQFRGEKAAKIKAVFSPSIPLMVHWDGKSFPVSMVDLLLTGCQFSSPVMACQNFWLCQNFPTVPDRPQQTLL